MMPYTHSPKTAWVNAQTYSHTNTFSAQACTPEYTHQKPNHSSGCQSRPPLAATLSFARCIECRVLEIELRVHARACGTYTHTHDRALLRACSCARVPACARARAEEQHTIPHTISHKTIPLTASAHINSHGIIVTPHSFTLSLAQQSHRFAFANEIRQSIMKVLVSTHTAHTPQPPRPHIGVCPGYATRT